MNKPRFTFLLPAYKICFLKDALKSILAQIYGDFRVVVSDDASPEPLKEIVDSFVDERISYRRNATNLGTTRLVQHWNLLLDSCDSDYVIIASDDDLYRPNFLEQIDALIREYPEANILRAAACIIDQDGKVSRTEKSAPQWLTASDFLGFMINSDSVLCIGNYVFKTSALKAMGGFISFPLGWKSDSATELLMAQNGIPSTGEVLFSFRMSGLNISSRNEPNREKDRAKLEALIAFDDWATTHLPAEVLKPNQAGLRNRLEGEARSYIWTLSSSEFRSLFSKFKREHWFRSTRNRLSFLLCRLRSHYA